MERILWRNIYYDGILTSTNRDENKHSAETGGAKEEKAIVSNI